jgi:hypothetical protein
MRKNRTLKIQKPTPFPGVSHKPRKTIPEPLTKTLKSKRFPKRYFGSLSKTKKIERIKELTKRGKMSWKDPKAYKDFETDKGGKTKTSKYIRKMRKLFEESGYTSDQYSSIEQKSEITGIPVSVLKASYDRGAAAWLTGHRTFANEGQWAAARVASLIVCGKAHYSADADLVRKAIEESPKAKEFWKKCDKK